MERHGHDIWSMQWVGNWLDTCIQRFAVNSLMVRWIPVMSALLHSSPPTFTQGLALLPVLLTSVIDVGSGIESTLSKLAVNPSLVMRLTCGKEGMQEEGDLERLQMWACAKLMKSSKAK